MNICRAQRPARTRQFSFSIRKKKYRIHQITFLASLPLPSQPRHQPLNYPLHIPPPAPFRPQRRLVRHHPIHLRHRVENRRVLPLPPAFVRKRRPDLLHLAHPPVGLVLHADDAALGRGARVREDGRELGLQFGEDAELVRGRVGLDGEGVEALRQGGKAVLGRISLFGGRPGLGGGGDPYDALRPDAGPMAGLRCLRARTAERCEPERGAALRSWGPETGMEGRFQAERVSERGASGEEVVGGAVSRSFGGEPMMPPSTKRMAGARAVMADSMLRAVEGEMAFKSRK